MASPSTETTAAEWDAATYHRVATPHVAWGERILARVPLRGDELVVDAGCGSGRLTAGLLDRLPRGRVIGVDRSANMLREARARLAPAHGDRVAFVRADLQTLALRPRADRIVSSAAFHWVPDHERLFAALFACLRPGGWLVAQCGGGPNLATLRAGAAELMRSPLFAPSFTGWAGPWAFAGADVTAARLRTAGFTQVITGLETSPERLPDAAAYREYVRTVVLGAHLARLPDAALRDRFLDDLTAQAAAATSPFSLDYWRLNIRAQRPES
jgi:trans-aconitate 2-methyltransferase